MSEEAVPLAITPEAAERLRAESDFSRSVLCVRHVLGCGGSGFRISVEENAPDEGHRFEASGIPVRTLNPCHIGNMDPGEYIRNMRDNIKELKNALM